MPTGGSVGNGGVEERLGWMVITTAEVPYQTQEMSVVDKAAHELVPEAAATLPI